MYRDKKPKRRRAGRAREANNLARWEYTVVRGADSLKRLVLYYGTHGSTFHLSASSGVRSPVVASWSAL